MKKCQNCGLEISSRDAVNRQFNEWFSNTNKDMNSLGEEFPYNCLGCNASITIKFELQPFFYINY